MTRVVAFRPGVTRSRTAFEAMARIYRYLHSTFGYEFTVVIGSDDEFNDPVLDVVTIPDRSWKPTIPRLPVFPRRLAYRRHVDPHLREADLVVTLDPTAYPQGSLAVARARRSGTPVWVDASATLNGDLPFLRALKRPFERRDMRRVSRVLVTAPKAIERFRDRRVFDEEIAGKFSVLGHPVDTDVFRPAPDSETDSIDVITVSRLVPEKGIRYVIEALEPLLVERDDVTYRVVGSGPMRSSLEALVQSRGIEEHVELLEPVPHEELPTVLNEHDIYVSHAVGNSHWEEFFGVANLEAMACGLACVVSRSGGIPYAIRRPDVVEFVSERDIVRLRETVEGLVDDPDERRRLGANGRRYVEDTYSVERIGDRYHKLVRQTLAG